MIWLHLTSTPIPVVNVHCSINEGTMGTTKYCAYCLCHERLPFYENIQAVWCKELCLYHLISHFVHQICHCWIWVGGRAAFSMEGMSRRGRRRCSCGPVLTCAGSWVAGHPLPCPPLLSLPLWGRLIHPNAPASPLASIWTYGDRVRGWGRMVRRKCTLQHQVLALPWPLPIPTHCHPARQGRQAHTRATSHINLWIMTEEEIDVWVGNLIRVKYDVDNDFTS